MQFISVAIVLESMPAIVNYTYNFIKLNPGVSLFKVVTNL